MKIQRNGEALLARARNRNLAIQITAELIKAYEHPAPHNTRTFLTKRDGDKWDYANNSRQAHLSCALAAHTTSVWP